MFYKARGTYGSHSLPEQQFLEYLKKKLFKNIVKLAKSLIYSYIKPYLKRDH